VYIQYRFAVIVIVVFFVIVAVLNLIYTTVKLGLIL